ncbi:RNA 2',3'-cyclic phosphodiesterase [Bacteroidota bacterium]
MNKGIYFLSIPLPEELVLKIREWRSAIMSDALIRWVRDDKLHITILFFGKIEIELLKEIEEKVSAVLQDFNSFDVNVTEARVKKLHNRRKNMLWLRLENNSEFERLYMELKNKLAAYADFRKGDFNPHITLARHVDKSFQLDQDFREFEHTMDLKSIELMESDRTGPEVKYVVQHSFSLDN